ncbi:cupin domain-containing protein [Leptothoe kymatousa]|uniref:Cupin domain-containing protein n=1 Tax=Leptothoe kymatousa TAU-MAC 1615 TaxID=2364775 RepID=A0ABS5XZY8_9CYAN|nr:cupin domain-containing protein [Leptothoe kymatousa]MBT9310799.1 cupin domain-containing protein [Leptothoe kymatousa TAU-MAC 1615]
MESVCTLPTSCVLPVLKSPCDYQVFRITPDDKNRLALLVDPTQGHAALTCCVEIFDQGGRTPSHRHQVAVEMFYVLQGEGRVVCDGKVSMIRTGDSILVPSHGIHFVENISAQRLYLLSVMVPNEDFAELIRQGVPAELDEEDLSVLGRTHCFR